MIETKKITDIKSRASSMWVLLATIIGSGMAIIDSTAVNVALPALTRDLGATEIEFLWIIDSYALFLSALILVGGVLGDMFGRRRIFMLGVILFGSTSICCGLAGSPLQLIIFRCLQGVGAAMLVPGSLAIISAFFPESERGKAIGWWSTFSALMVAIGPVLGGWFVDIATWRLVFLINVPLSLAVLWISFFHVPESFGASSKARIDWLGALLAVFGLGALVYGIILGGKIGFDNVSSSGMVILGITALLAFLVTESKVSYPMMPLSLFRSNNFTGANLLTILLYAPLGGGILFLPIVMIEVYEYPAILAGASLLPVVFMIALLSRVSGGLLSRTGATVPLIVGPIIAGLGYTYFSIPGFSGNYWTTFFPGFVLLGLGMSIVVVPLTTVVMTAFDQDQAGVASGINNAASRISGVIAVALFGALVTTVFTIVLEDRMALLDLPNFVLTQLQAQSNLLTASEIPSGLSKETATLVKSIINESLLSGLQAAMLLSAALAFSSSVFAAVMIRYKPTQS